MGQMCNDTVMLLS